ncbi:MAG: glutamate 5-kinase [Oscillospiraceae bacterium]|nr:glutamate 5-kinase [Oscillospiraceae bacterium]
MEAKRVVVKVGTSTLTHESGALYLEHIEKLVRVLCDLIGAGHEVIFVSSGAIAVGVSSAGLPERPESLREKQAAAAVGQCRLMHIYDKIAAEYGVLAAQILLTRGDFDDPERKNNLLNTIDTLLTWNVLPVLNENDSVCPKEIEAEKTRVFGDNDALSAMVARLAAADLLVLMTDSDGFFTGDPRSDPDARLLTRVSELTPQLLGATGGAGTRRGTGGMVTKLAAARIALDAGIDMVIVNGRDPSVLYRLLRGETVGTLFSRRFAQ